MTAALTSDYKAASLGPRSCMHSSQRPDSAVCLAILIPEVALLRARLPLPSMCPPSAITALRASRALILRFLSQRCLHRLCLQTVDFDPLAPVREAACHSNAALCDLQSPCDEFDKRGVRLAIDWGRGQSDLRQTGMCAGECSPGGPGLYVDCDASADVHGAWRELPGGSLLPLTAARMPCRIRAGLGGHPGTATSTGMTFETRPQLA